jgi:hypothetical protein
MAKPTGKRINKRRRSVAKIIKESSMNFTYQAPFDLNCCNLSSVTKVIAIWTGTLRAVIIAIK